MKKLFGLILVISFFSCNDGDFDVPSFEFTETVNSCGEYVLYRLNESSTEVILITLNANDLRTSKGETSINLSSNQEVIYRIFDEQISTDYFCQNIPPASPNVIKELTASGGILEITTTEVLNSANEVTGLKHSIQIVDLTFIDAKERIYFETFNFGEIVISN